MKTIKDWLNELEEPYKSQAIANTHKDCLKARWDCLSDALGGSFVWSNSPEGFDYWLQLDNKLKNENR